MMQTMILNATSCLWHSDVTALITVANEPQTSKDCVATHGNHQAAFNLCPQNPVAKSNTACVNNVTI